MNPRLDQVMIGLMDTFGVQWMIFAAVVLLFLMFAPLLRAFLGALLMFLCIECWYSPLQNTIRELRWWLLLILCIRSIRLLVAVPGIAGETRWPHRVLAALGVMAMLSALWATDKMYSFQIAVSFVVGLVLTFGLLWRLLDDPGAIPALCRAIVVFSFLIFSASFIAGFLAWFTDSVEFIRATGWPWSVYEESRFSGIFWNANMLGILGALVLPIVLATPKNLLGSVAGIRWITVGLVAFGVYLTGSRSAAIGCIFAVSLLALYRYGGSMVMVGGLAAVTLVFLILMGPADIADSKAISHITRTEQLSDMSGRFELWQLGWDSAQDSLAFGRGWAELRVLEDGSREDALSHGSVIQGSNLHNAHLQLLVDLGFTGVFLFWTFLLMVLRAGWYLLRAPRTPQAALIMVVFASVMAMIADTVAHGWVFSTGSATALAFWFCCAVVLKEVDRMRRGEKWRSVLGGVQTPTPRFHARPQVRRPSPYGVSAYGPTPARGSGGRRDARGDRGGA